MTPIQLLKASGAPVFILEQGGMITVHKGRFFSQRAAKCGLHNLPSVLHYLGTAVFINFALCRQQMENKQIKQLAEAILWFWRLSRV